MSGTLNLEEFDNKVKQFYTTVMLLPCCHNQALLARKQTFGVRCGWSRTKFATNIFQRVIWQLKDFFFIIFHSGTFCDRQKDCVGSNLCCVREPAINPVISICKPALDEHQTCGPYNQFRTVYIGGTVQPVCGPCKQGLVCKQVG